MTLSYKKPWEVMSRRAKVPLKLGCEKSVVLYCMVAESMVGEERK